MLIGIDPLLSPECLATLRAMGHGDEMVLGDANFPAWTACRSFRCCARS
jgi:L-fucose mutarotase